MELLIAKFNMIEILPIMVVSFIGACIHEYIFKQEGGHFSLFNFNLWISIFVSIILCYIIDPWIIEYNDRLVLLPPLLFGLAGMDLVKRMATTKGLFNIVINVLKVFGIKINIPQEDGNNQNSTNSNEDEMRALTELDNIVHENLHKIYHTQVQYYTNHDKNLFLAEYQTIKVDLELMHQQLLNHQMIPINTTVALSEILKKELELDTIYHDLINNHDI